METTIADDARQWICELADHHSWETVAREMISRMSSDEAEEFVEYFIFKGDLGRQVYWHPKDPYGVQYLTSNHSINQTNQMTYKELLDQLQQLNPEQLDADVMIQDYDNEYHGYKVELVFATDAQNVLDVDHPVIRF